MSKNIPARPRFEQGETWEAPLEEVVPNSGLLDAYPQLRKIIIGYRHKIDGPSETRKSGGAYFYHSNRILIEGQDNVQFESILQHEVDHVVKRIGGGPSGGQIESDAMEGTPDWKRAYRRYRNIPGEKLARAASEVPFDEYFKMPGYRASSDVSSKPVKSGLLKRLLPFLSFCLIVSCVFFLSSNVTGNAITNLSSVTSSWIGGVLFFVGLVGCFFWIRAKNR